MNPLIDTITNLFETSVFNITYKNVIMILLACILQYFAIKKEYELTAYSYCFWNVTCQSVRIYGFTSHNANGDLVPGGLLHYLSG